MLPINTPPFLAGHKGRRNLITRNVLKPSDGTMGAELKSSDIEKTTYSSGLEKRGSAAADQLPAGREASKEFSKGGTWEKQVNPAHALTPET